MASTKSGIAVIGVPHGATESWVSCVSRLAEGYDVGAEWLDSARETTLGDRARNLTMGNIPIIARARPTSKCCVDCFTHPWVKEQIQADSTETGQCDYCGTRRRRLLPIIYLADPFENMAGMYASDNDGVSLIDVIQSEWCVFSDKLHSSGRSKDLLEDILNSNWDDDDGEPPVDAWDYVSARDVLSDVETWEGFCDAVRDDSNQEPDFGETFAEDLENTSSTLQATTLLFRARLGFSIVERVRQPFRGQEIGAPPPELVKAGRANREGRSVLYCTQDEPTAVSEVRPARGYWVSTCQVRLNRDARILDLVDGIPVPNPFTNESVAWYAQFAKLLQSFARELSTPLARSDDISDYLPSQKLSEYVAALGHDGIRYPSAMHNNGANIVLFDPTIVDILESRLVEVVSLELKLRPR